MRIYSVFYVSLLKSALLYIRLIQIKIKSDKKKCNVKTLFNQKLMKDKMFCLIK